MAGQGANNGPSQAAGSRYVKFGRQSAQRIAKAVRTVEAGDRGQPPLTFDHPQGLGGKVFRMGTFTAAWNKNTWHVVTYLNATATVQAYNVFVNVGTAGSTTHCAIARDGTAWYLIAAEC